MKSLPMLLAGLVSVIVLPSCSSTSSTALVPVNTRLNDPGRTTYAVKSTAAAEAVGGELKLVPVNTRLNDPGRTTYRLAASAR